MTEEDFNTQTRAIAELNGITIELAGRYLVLVGDTPELADDGCVIVEDENGNEIARLKLPE